MRIVCQKCDGTVRIDVDPGRIRRGEDIGEAPSINPEICPCCGISLDLVGILEQYDEEMEFIREQSLLSRSEY